MSTLGQPVLGTSNTPGSQAPSLIAQIRAKCDIKMSSQQEGYPWPTSLTFGLLLMRASVCIPDASTPRSLAAKFTVALVSQSHTYWP